MSHTSVELPLAVETSLSLVGSEESADVRWRLTPFRLVLAKEKSADVRRRFIPFLSYFFASEPAVNVHFTGGSQMLFPLLLVHTKGPKGIIRRV